MNDQPEIPIPDDSSVKEVYAFIGLAMYNAQVFEKGILNLLVTVKTTNSLPVTRQDVDDFYDRFDRRTLGQLLHEVRKQVSIDDELEDRICHALVRRNDLAHQYFWRYAEEFMTDRGRVKMIDGLRQDARDFIVADGLVSPVLFSYASKFGMTESVVQEMYDEAVERIAQTDALLEQYGG